MSGRVGTSSTCCNAGRACPVLLSLKNVSLNLGRTALLDKANLTLEPGERLCLMAATAPASPRC